jgi:hypothetical protein
VTSAHYLVSAKLTRAGEHLDALEASITDYLDSNALRAMPGADNATQESIIRVQVVREPPVAAWAVQIGDVLHNLRSGLDHLAWHLGGNPPPNEANSEFPIFRKRREFRRQGLPKIEGVPRHPAAIIEDLQPFQRGQEAHLDPLWLLHELSNYDKHRLLHTVVAALRGASYFVSAPAGSRTEDPLVMRGPVKHGTVIARWPLDPEAGIATPDVGRPFQLHFEIAFDADGPGNGQPVGEQLRRVSGYVGRVVLPRLAPFLF